MLCKKERKRKKKPTTSTPYSSLPYKPKCVYLNPKPWWQRRCGEGRWGALLGKPGDSRSGDSLFAHPTLTVWQKGFLMAFYMYIIELICLYIIYKYLFTARLSLIRNKHSVGTEHGKEKKKKKKALTLPLSFACRDTFLWLVSRFTRVIYIRGATMKHVPFQPHCPIGS